MSDNRDDLVSTCDGHTQGKVLVSTGTGFTQAHLNDVRLVGFGTFLPVSRAAGMARNPRTGQSVPRPAV